MKESINKLENNEAEELIIELDNEKITASSDEEVIVGVKELYNTEEAERISNDSIYIVKIPPENDLWDLIRSTDENLQEKLEITLREKPISPNATLFRESQKTIEKNITFSIQDLETVKKPGKNRKKKSSWEKDQINYVLPNSTNLKNLRPIGIATLDTGINPNHVGFQDILWKANSPFEIPINNQLLTFPKDSLGFDVFNVSDPQRRGIPEDTDIFGGHGTRVAGVIGAKGIGMFDRSPFPVSLLPIRAFTRKGFTISKTPEVLMALDFVTEARKALSQFFDLCVVNISFGYFQKEMPYFSEILENKINQMVADGIIFVCSAGNDRTNVDQKKQSNKNSKTRKWSYFPASISSKGVVSVAATNAGGTLWVQSNFGKKSVHIAAPGKEVLTTNRDEDEVLVSGTSAAAPFVSSCIALLLMLNPDLIKEKPKEILIDNANIEKILEVFSEGKLNVFESLTNVKQPPIK